MISFAIFGPTSQGSSITTMPAPNFSSGSPKNAVSLAIVMSQASMSSNAPARHGPRTAASVGFGQCQKRITASKSLRSTARHSSKPVGLRSICSLRSKPEENAAPAPVTTTTRAAESASARSIARLISSSMRALSALARSGRESVSVATASFTSYRIVSKVIVRSPQPRGRDQSRGVGVPARRRYRSCRRLYRATLRAPLATGDDSPRALR